MIVAGAFLFVASLAALAADQAKNLLKDKDPAKSASWRFEQFEQGQGKMTEDDGGILLDVTHTHTFKAEDVAADSKNRIGFMVGSDTGKVWIKDVSLTTK
jgi:hypothetical protein